MNCPIGLICELMECRPNVCQEYADPVPLPYEILEEDVCFYSKGTLLVSLPKFITSNWDRYEPLDRSYERNAYNERLRLVILGQLNAGWADAVNLPYRYDFKHKALLVFSIVLFDHYGTKHRRNETDISREDRGFCPPLDYKETYKPRFENYQEDIQADGFCKYFLCWQHDFDNRDIPY